MELWVLGGVLLAAMVAAVALAAVAMVKRARALRVDVDRSREQVAELSRSVEKLSGELAASQAPAPARVPDQRE